MKLVKLTRVDTFSDGNAPGEHFWVNPHHVVNVRQISGAGDKPQVCQLLMVNGMHEYVHESAEEVVELLNMPRRWLELAEAARQVLWKLDRDEKLTSYEGPARITRQDATVRMLHRAVFGDDVYSPVLGCDQ